MRGNIYHFDEAGNFRGILLVNAVLGFGYVLIGGEIVQRFIKQQERRGMGMDIIL